MSTSDDPGVARNTAYALLTQLTTAAFTAVLTLYLVRTLGAEDFGLLSLALGITALLMLPADLGIAQSAGRFIAERRSDPEAASALLAGATRLKLLAAGAVATALFVLAGPIADAYGQDGLAWPLRGTAVALFGQSMVIFYSQVFLSVRRVAVNLQLVLLESLVEFGATLALVVMGAGAGGAAFGRAIGYVAGALIGFALALRIFGRGAARLRSNRDGTAGLIGRYAGALLVVNGIFSLFSQIDVLLIGAILGPVAVGVFSAPLRLVTLSHYAGLALSNSVSPRVARGPSGTPDVGAFTAGLRLLLVVQMAIAVPVLVWAGEVVDLLGADYEESGDVLRAMSLFVFVQGLGPLVSVSVNYLGEARRRIPIALLALLVNLVIDLALLREIGPVAGAIGVSAGYTIYVIGHIAICRRLLGFALRPLALTLVRAVLAGAALGGILFAFGTDDLGIVDYAGGLSLGMAAFVAVLVLTGEISRAETRRLRGLLRR